MLHSPEFGPRLRAAAALICAMVVAGCGGGDVEVVVDAGPPPVAPLAIALTRVGPEAIEVDWSDDPYVARFLVRRDGYALATVTTTSLIDASVFVNERYCYQVSGYDSAGLLVAASATGCVTVFP